LECWVCWRILDDDAPVLSKKMEIGSVCEILQVPVQRIFTSVTTREKNMFKKGKNLDRHLPIHAILPHQPHIRVPGNGVHPWFFLDNSWLD
jgi:hypothetical protein